MSGGSPFDRVFPSTKFLLTHTAMKRMGAIWRLIKGAMLTVERMDAG